MDFNFEPRPVFGVELKHEKPIPYIAPVSRLQRDIEMAVTNGRGYVHLQDSIDIVNARSDSFPKVRFFDALNRGFIPLYLDGPVDYFDYTMNTRNPCAEIPLGPPSPVTLPIRFPKIERTLLEEVESIQTAKHALNTIRRGCFGPIFEPSYQSLFYKEASAAFEQAKRG